MNLTSRELELQLDRVRILESNVTFQFSVVSKLMDQNAQELLIDTPLNLTAYRLMKTVDTFRAISIADLSRHMITDNAQISRVAAELGKKGLVDFETDPKSKRRKMLVLSTDGRALMERLSPRFSKRQQAVSDCLGEDLRASLKEVFEKLTAHFAV